ncbi:DJ-1/PfpI family protein, partial [Bacillus sp. GbtcB13]|uniref:DJ-1/PfpI family protein n=1 Tax=Bacillus sp. GbtcB13 TaxID=2824758 RepID=UPI001C2FD040
PILKKAGEALELGAMVAAICGATAGLANNGYWNSRKHTSNDLAYMKMVCPHFKVDPFYEMDPAGPEENLVSASGLAPL